MYTACRAAIDHNIPPTPPASPVIDNRRAPVGNTSKVINKV